MQRLLQRLDRSLKWTLIAPQSGDGPSAVAEHRGAEQQALLQRVLRARQVAVGGSPEPQEAQETQRRFTAAGAWHLVALDAAGEVAGAVRLYIVDRWQDSLAPADLLRFVHIAFPSPAIQEQHMEALQHLFEQKADERFFFTAVGLFTTLPWRGSGLAAILGVAAVAMARLHDSRFSASFTAVRGCAQDLFAMFGGRPAVLPDGGPIAPFVCQRHGFELQLLAFGSHAPEPRAEAGVQMLTERLTALMPRQEQPA